MSNADQVILDAAPRRAVVFAKGFFVARHVLSFRHYLLAGGVAEFTQAYPGSEGHFENGKGCEPRSPYRDEICRIRQPGLRLLKLRAPPGNAG